MSRRPANDWRSKGRVVPLRPDAAIFDEYPMNTDIGKTIDTLASGSLPKVSTFDGMIVAVDGPQALILHSGGWRLRDADASRSGLISQVLALGFEPHVRLYWLPRYQLDRSYAEYPQDTVSGLVAPTVNDMDRDGRDLYRASSIGTVAGAAASLFSSNFVPGTVMSTEGNASETTHPMNIEVGKYYAVTESLLKGLNVGDELIPYKKVGEGEERDGTEEAEPVNALTYSDKKTWVKPLSSYVVGTVVGRGKENGEVYLHHSDKEWTTDRDAVGKFPPEKPHTCSNYIYHTRGTVVFLTKHDGKTYKAPPIKLALEHFDTLTLPKEMKEEIVAVLRQHSHRDKIMNEWGLGEVIEYGHGSTMLFWGKPGCLAGDTIVEINRAGKSFKIRLDELVHKFNGGGTKHPITGNILTWDHEIPTTIRSHDKGNIRLVPLIAALVSGKKETFAVETSSGRKVRATHDHPFLTTVGWKKLEELAVGDLIVSDGTYSTKGKAEKRRYVMENNVVNHPRSHGGFPLHILVAEAGLNDMSTDEYLAALRANDLDGLSFIDTGVYSVHHKDGDILNNDASNLEILTHSEHARRHGEEGGWRHVTIQSSTDKVVSIAPYGIEETFDLTVESDDPNFLANGLIVHNTGKTWAGKVIARTLGQELKVIGTAELQSNVPGEFERNVKKTFALAKAKKHVLLIDECDGLVQSRVGMGQIMSAENNTLMQEIEQFDGVCILTTNRADSLDEALERRMALIMEFPMPDFDARLEIWDRFLPSRLPLAGDVNKEKIAEWALTGGQIKNAVLNAARHAVSREAEEVSMADFERSIKRVKEGSKAFSSPRSTGLPPGARFIGGNDEKRATKVISSS